MLSYAVHLVYCSSVNIHGGPIANSLGVCPCIESLKPHCHKGDGWRAGKQKGNVTQCSIFYELSERIQGCSACRSGLGSHDKHVALASVIRNTKLVFGSFSARYILKSTRATHTYW